MMAVLSGKKMTVYIEVDGKWCDVSGDCTMFLVRPEERKVDIEIDGKEFKWFPMHGVLNKIKFFWRVISR